MGVGVGVGVASRLRGCAEGCAFVVFWGIHVAHVAMLQYCRLTPDNKSIVGRWPSQMSELKQLQDLSGIDGWAPEYWSPAPAWKDSGSYYGGTLASFNESFLDAFSDSVQHDVKYLRNNGLRIKWWGLQNEPIYEVNNMTVQCNRSDIESPVSRLAPCDPERKWFYSQCVTNSPHPLR